MGSRNVSQVEHPAHYGGDVPYEAIKVIEVWEVEWRARGLGGFSLGSATKYICRAGAKGDAITDLQKARQYLDFEIARLETLP